MFEDSIAGKYGCVCYYTGSKADTTTPAVSGNPLGAPDTSLGGQNTADNGVLTNSFNPDVLPDSESVTQPTATDSLPTVVTDPPATTAATTDTTAGPTQTESTTEPADTTTVIPTTASVTTASPAIATGTSSGPIMHTPNTPVPTTPTPRPTPHRNRFRSLWDLLQLILALCSESGLGPLLLSQLNQQPNQQSANNVFGNLPLSVLCSEKLRPLYLASQISRHFGGGLTGSVVATRFLDLPEGYLGANFIYRLMRMRRRNGGASSSGSEEESSGFTGRRSYRNFRFRPWMLGMMET